MATSSRKQREIRAREEFILDVGRRMLLERGFDGLTMDRVADAIEYSKGTLYQHFTSKEDLLAGIIAQTGGMRADLFERGAAWDGPTRERMAGIGVAFDLFARLYPAHFRAEMIVATEQLRNEGFRARLSAERLARIDAADERCNLVMKALIEDAVAQGDLRPDSADAMLTLHFGLWGLSFGSYMLMHCEPDLAEKGFTDPTRHLQVAQDRLIDGFGWTPLSTEHDYLAARERILREVFPDEHRLALG